MNHVYLTVASDKSQELVDILLNLYSQYKENVMTVARQLERRGERRGEIKGRIQGRMEGKIEGKMEGKIEGKKEIALNMLSKHYDIEEIAKLTNLSREEIDLLRKQNTFS